MTKWKVHLDALNIENTQLKTLSCWNTLTHTGNHLGLCPAKPAKTAETKKKLKLKKVADVAINFKMINGSAKLWQTEKTTSLFGVNRKF